MEGGGDDCGVEGGGGAEVLEEGVGWEGGGEGVEEGEEGLEVAGGAVEEFEFGGLGGGEFGFGKNLLHYNLVYQVYIDFLTLQQPQTRHHRRPYHPRLQKRHRLALLFLLRDPGNQPSIL